MASLKYRTLSSGPAGHTNLLKPCRIPPQAEFGVNPRVTSIKARAAFTLSLILATFPAHAFATPSEERLAHFTPWFVDWTTKTCKMRRVFGDPQNFVVLQIERFAPGDNFQVVVTGNRLKSLRDGEQLLISYGDSANEKATLFQQAAAENGMPSIIIAFTSLAPAFVDPQPASVAPQMEVVATSINLAWSDKKIILQTGALASAFAALRTCTDDLVKTWGLDPAVQKSLTRRANPKSSPATWLRSEDFPKNALWDGKQALVNFRLSIDLSGRPTACEVQRSYSNPEFDKRTCDLILARAKFEPALDENGVPVASYYAGFVRWMIR